ncbi:type II toxin-antitoxin system RelE/ParE family toxin [Jiella avicenniae]|uniref:Type II toxin-antitoxin system RelE/ParE family toxin n=1 Tax=Jiella avicenniae TaxID=2907202 RepID=A0A9X1NWZ6_9HYPH|nr:type II toxin-antitoxin system RelE/ParE family toxin [Jiella avicenniae]MCE7027300.1 type II toxin-antitoxin system RelE/ParE family toxin [Jiella avicenniae]
MAFRLTPRAETDITEIALYIAGHSPKAALRWQDDILKHCRNLGRMPRAGVARPEIRPDLRTFPVGNYLILYRESGDDDAEIIRVLHGARRWQDLID